MDGLKIESLRSKGSGNAVDPESTGEVVHPINVYPEAQEVAFGNFIPDMQSVSVNDSVSQCPVPGSKVTVAVS